MRWKNQFVAVVQDTNVELIVTQLSTFSWSWDAVDVEEEGQDIFSSETIYVSELKAKEAAEDWYKSTWLPRFQATGERLLEYGKD